MSIKPIVEKGDSAAAVLLLKRRFHDLARTETDEKKKKKKKKKEDRFWANFFLSNIVSSCGIDKKNHMSHRLVDCK